MVNINLSIDHMLVLQQVNEAGLEEFTALSETLNFNKGYLGTILQNLRRNGYIVIEGTWVKLSPKGRRLIDALWLDLQLV